MSIDIKRLLYSYQKLQVGLTNIKESIMREQSRRLYPSCTAGYSDDIRGKGGLPSSQTERYALINVDHKVERLTQRMNEYEYAITLIKTSLESLSAREQELIRLMYFEGVEPNVAHLRMHISLSRYYHIHKTAIDGISICLNVGDVHMNHLIPMKKQRKSSKNARILVLN
jgi:predicted DNA-binding protein (UPF0251 family)